MPVSPDVHQVNSSMKVNAQLVVIIVPPALMLIPVPNAAKDKSSLKEFVFLMILVLLDRLRRPLVMLPCYGPLLLY